MWSYLDVNNFKEKPNFLKIETYMHFRFIETETFLKIMKVVRHFRVVKRYRVLYENLQLEKILLRLTLSKV